MLAGRAYMEHHDQGNTSACGHRGNDGAVTPNLEEWLPGQPSDTTVQKSTLLGTSEILHRTLKLRDLWWRT